MATMVKVFGCRSAYENRPSTNPRGCVKVYGDFGFLPNAIMAASGRRSCRGGCGERDFAPGGRWIGSSPPARLRSLVTELAKGVFELKGSGPGAQPGHVMNLNETVVADKDTIVIVGEKRAYDPAKLSQGVFELITVQWSEIWQKK